jgi:hypothetical protein
VSAAETTLARHQESVCMLSSPPSTATTMRRPAVAAGGDAMSIASELSRSGGTAE